jgi:hypothetical protein
MIRGKPCREERPKDLNTYLPYWAILDFNKHFKYTVMPDAWIEIPGDISAIALRQDDAHWSIHDARHPDAKALRSFSGLSCAAVLTRRHRSWSLPRVSMNEQTTEGAHKLWLL